MMERISILGHAAEAADCSESILEHACDKHRNKGNLREQVIDKELAYTVNI